MLDDEEKMLLARVDANVSQLLRNDTDKEARLKCLEASHNRMKGIVYATNAISGALWATVVLCFPNLVSYFKDK